VEPGWYGSPPEGGRKARPGGAAQVAQSGSPDQGGARRRRGIDEARRKLYAILAEDPIFFLPPQSSRDRLLPTGRYRRIMWFAASALAQPGGFELVLPRLASAGSQPAAEPSGCRVRPQLTCSPPILVAS
jgi:hypothetical protein